LILLDTHVLIFDALAPQRLSKRATRAIRQGAEERSLAISDISLWEISMLIAKARFDPGTTPESFLEDLIGARGLVVLAITPAIAVLANSDRFPHADPADRIIGSTALVHGNRLVTADARLQGIKGLTTVW
jgi:PIN domain nuclease of toxin-antitoxin system